MKELIIAALEDMMMYVVDVDVVVVVDVVIPMIWRGRCFMCHVSGSKI
jgi:hypothetical protein